MFQSRPSIIRDLAALEDAQAAFAGTMDRLSELQRRIDALEAQRAQLVAEAPALAAEVERLDGATGSRLEEFARRSARAEVAIAMRVSEYAADRIIGDAELLVRRLPSTLAAVERGDVSWRAATLVAQAAGTLDTGTDGDADRSAGRMRDFETAALDLAGRVAPARLRARLQQLRDRCMATPPQARHAAAREERYVAVDDLEDGMSRLSALLPAVDAHAIDHRLSDLARATRDADAADGIDDGRTLSQRRADLLVDYLVGDYIRGAADLDPVASLEEYERRVAAGRDFGRFAGIRPTVVVTVPVGALLGDDEPALLDGVVPIDAATARQLTANATGLYRMLTDAHTGVRLDLSRERYQVTPGLRMWLRMRDETCRFPGCGRRARGCDIDHTIDWQHGGETRADNLAHLCRSHHTLKHRARWNLRQLPDGTIVWRGPAGREYQTHPGGQLPAPQSPATTLSA
ncbi:MAG TPA: DUF222 domain-containing protein [Microbacteriaceae bacterium]|nr:DUF222 domain-containing protein [Microbacteriaceae bacterium]